MKVILTILCVSCLVACAGRSKKGGEVALKEAPVTTDFDKGLKALEREEYTEAARIFDKLLVAKPATELDLVTMYNSGAAHEGLNDCAKSADRYRQVVRSSAGRFKRIEGQALYRLSLMYECLGQDSKTITALLDARKRGTELPWATLNAEIPARLAAAYARMGNRTKALEYFQKASQALKRLVSQETGRRQQDVLGQTLFLMGQLNPSQRGAKGDPTAFLQGLSMQQPYLLQAVEIAHPNWSKRAAEDLLLAYDNIWKLQPQDPEEQNKYFTRALQTTRELKRIRLPGKSDARLDEIFAKVDETESRLQHALAKVGPTNRLTPEAQRREGLKREGRLVTPKKR